MSRYENFTRDELLKILDDLESKRAFTYEDQLKLAILDKSPFTIWASDRNCMIKMWDGQCESMYGRKKEDVLGRDFVDLFVAPDEQAAARRDQIEIIDNDKAFHNIANDHGRNGNTLQLITNCFRIKDPKTGEYWNAEMGVAIDYYEEEKKQLERNIAEGRLIQALIIDFSVTQNQYREQFLDRKESLLEAIRNGRLEAAKQKRYTEYLGSTRLIEQRILEINEEIDNTIDEFYKKIKNCTSSSSCMRIKTNFITVIRNILNKFSDIVVDFEIISYETTNSSGIIPLKDEVMKLTSAESMRLQTVVDEIWLNAEDAIKEYRGMGLKIDNNSTRMRLLTSKRDDVLKVKEEIHNIENEIYSQLNNTTTENTIRMIKGLMESKFLEVEASLKELKRRSGA